MPSHYGTHGQQQKKKDPRAMLPTPQGISAAPLTGRSNPMSGNFFGADEEQADVFSKKGATAFGGTVPVGGLQPSSAPVSASAPGSFGTGSQISGPGLPDKSSVWHGGTPGGSMIDLSEIVGQNQDLAPGGAPKDIDWSGENIGRNLQQPGAAPGGMPAGATDLGNGFYVDPSDGMIKYGDFGENKYEKTKSGGFLGFGKSTKKHSYGKKAAVDALSDFYRGGMHLSDPRNFDTLFPSYYEDLFSDDVSQYGMDAKTKGASRELFGGLSGLNPDKAREWLQTDRDTYGGPEDYQPYMDATRFLDEHGSWGDSEVAQQIRQNMEARGRYRDSDLFSENEAWSNAHRDWVTGQNARDLYERSAGMGAQGLGSSSQARDLFQDSRLDLLGDLYENQAHREGAGRFFDANERSLSNLVQGAGRHQDRRLALQSGVLGAGADHARLRDAFARDRMGDRWRAFGDMRGDYGANQAMRYDAYGRPLQVAQQIAGGGPAPSGNQGWADALKGWIELGKKVTAKTAGGDTGGSG